MPPIDLAAYKSWLASRSQSAEDSQKANAGTDLPDSPSANTPSLSEPTYPSSFAHIVELIATGQPIPGIQEIPDTVLTGHDISSEKPPRRKPWENEEVNNTTEKRTSSSA